MISDYSDFYNWCKIFKYFEQMNLGIYYSDLLNWFSIITGLFSSIDNLFSDRDCLFSLSFLHYTNKSENAKPAEGAKNLKSDLDSTIKSDVLGFISNIMENYSNWLATLSTDKIVAVFNIIIDSVLLVNLFSVISLLMGEHLIEFFKLDVRYPKLAKLIRLKNTVSKYYKTMYLVLYLLFLTFGILGNMFMLFIEYFL